MIPSQMSTEAKALKAAYMREWRKNNQERLRVHNKAYWEKKAQRESEITEDEKLIKQIEKLHEKGMSLRDIAACFDISHMKVSRILKVIIANKLPVTDFVTGKLFVSK